MNAVKKAPRKELFRFGDRVWDVEKAQKLVSARKPFISTEEVKGLWSWICDDHDDPKLWEPLPDGKGRKFIGRTGMIYVDWKYVRSMPKSRLRKPLLIGQVRGLDNGKKIQSLVIDGWHRIARAKLEGIERLPVSWLNPQETAAVEIEGR